MNRAALEAFITHLDAFFHRPGRLYLVGETTLVFEGWRAWTEQIQVAAEVAPEDRAAFAQAVRRAQARVGVDVLEESPGDLIPLPDGFEARARPAGEGAAAGSGYGHLQVYHFDPYSVAFRHIARGDEPDYHLVLAFLEQGWMTVEEMDAMLAGLLPRFTAETIQQDPAEFRRKYKGLLQMWRAVRPGTTHRPTPV